jgi:hypothetical protein
MKNLFKLSSLLFIGLVLFQVSCKDDPAPVTPIPDPSGEWQLTKAVLVEPDPLTVEFYPASPISAGDFQATTPLVAGALAGTACEVQENYATFFLELKASSTPGTGTLIFHCPAENDFSREAGSWSVLKDTNGDYTVLNLSVIVEGIPIAVQITVSDWIMTLDNNNFSGRASGYPMVKSLAIPISPDNSQFITTDLTFVRRPI